MTRIEQKGLREIIVETALAIKRQYGCAAVSIEAICQITRIRPTGFYRHFASLSDLRQSVCGDQAVLAA